ISKLRKNLDTLISNGEWVRARLSGNTEVDVERCDLKVKEWDKSVERALKGTEYEHSWISGVGLTNPEDESQLSGFDWHFAVHRNYMFKCLIQLKKIRDSL
ncbi:hypothetical protein ACFLYE_04880, partial [Chloroflexota bacterium]